MQCHEWGPCFYLSYLKSCQKPYQPPVRSKTILKGDQDLISVPVGNIQQANKMLLKGGWEEAEAKMEGGRWFKGSIFITNALFVIKWKPWSNNEEGLFGIMRLLLLRLAGTKNSAYVSTGNRRGVMRTKRKVLILYLCGHTI